jgi:nucleoid-associated protein YgaU
VTPAEPDEVIEPAPAAPDHTDEPLRTRRRWPWFALVVVIVVAVLGIVVGVGIVRRGRSFGPPLPSETTARPTFVIAAAASPSPSGSLRPGALPSATANDEYTVEAGDSLRSIAQQVYGDPAQWPRIYDANSETIGPDPDALSAGTRLRIPRS